MKKFALFGTVCALLLGALLFANRKPPQIAHAAKIGGFRGLQIHAGK